MQICVTLTSQQRLGRWVSPQPSLLRLVLVLLLVYPSITWGQTDVLPNEGQTEKGGLFSNFRRPLSARKYIAIPHGLHVPHLNSTHPLRAQSHIPLSYVVAFSPASIHWMLQLFLSSPNDLIALYDQTKAIEARIPLICAASNKMDISGDSAQSPCTTDLMPRSGSFSLSMPHNTSV